MDAKYTKLEMLPPELLQHQERLRSAVLHVSRDETAKSWLVALELPDWKFKDEALRLKAESYIDGQVEALRRVLMEAWDSWHGKDCEASR